MAANTAAPSGLEKEQVGTFCFRYFVTQKLDDFFFVSVFVSLAFQFSFEMNDSNVCVFLFFFSI
jgi:hypothetical protein